MDRRVAKVISINDLSGVDQVDIFRTTLIQSAKTNRNDRFMLAFFIRSLQYLSTVLPQNLDFHSTNLEVEIDGQVKEKEFDVITKPMSTQPIYELRLDFPEYNTWIRATFFKRYHRKKLHYCFVKAFIKTMHPSFNPTTPMIQETYNVYQELRNNPALYLK
ncbi:hypothetical protein [Halobacillus sp. Marseille-Q1614]|uniref:hypothetical protein n=1 Tax=Halobacillus sp. Marseille-Q1614 TaxID=2709134 RepID=UPI001570E57F|nr:hypothetical protein [Halobacillus sp. Marseille-Q1614]